MVQSELGTMLLIVIFFTCICYWCWTDVLATTKNNVAWHRIPITEQLPEQTQSWWEACQINTTHNTIDPDANPYQPGGVAILSLNKSAHHVSSYSQDLGGLGRVCWTTYHRKNNWSL